MDQKRVLNYPSQLALLFGLMGVGLVVSSIFVALLGGTLMHVPYKQVVTAINLPENANTARLLNTLAAFCSFFLPAFVVARMVSKKPFRQLGFRRVASSKQLLIVLTATFASMVLGGALGELTEKIPLPKDLYAQAKALEDTYKTAMMSMASMKNAGDYLLALLVIGIAPAIFEEVLFRSGFQQIFVGWTKSKWAGIIITSILFSAIHFSYFGFISRFALGMVLGLIFYYSKNIWLNIFLHFLNNALIVTQLYVLSKKGKPIEQAMDENMPIWWGLFALAVLVVLLRSFRKESERVLAANEQMIHSSPENIHS